jgi:hypothetical protein
MTLDGSRPACLKEGEQEALCAKSSWHVRSVFFLDVIHFWLSCLVPVSLE